MRSSLLDKNAKGPDVIYGIAMDIGRIADRADLIQRHLLYGAVIYASGHLGKEPIRSQGHIHSISPSAQFSTPEVYEIWEGKCIVLMQETANKDPGRVFVIHASPGELIIVPPRWAHCTISALSGTPLVFGAWCIRDYGFEYEQIRSHHGLAFYPILNNNEITWRYNDHYKKTLLIEKTSQRYTGLGIKRDKPIYTQYTENQHAFDFVTKPQKYMDIWNNFIP
ncbi:glucose-6-phosphate isomerase family protein [Liquorilactobacillus oeni]|uniref:glucose-6-phosphate isomerase n=1 Tax=Liquorilactobacillus oeni DSM 19972 TaxID=1423777 RepID=A0A0R1MAY5_9LACO|nr:glucose-6-phosphate isomerase family protein [Liquorilactobacillus oeni]KRL05073.1 hypothetical protein FD46_GL001014 [Liquorilactobacillus oeni DSM 19972]